MQTEPDTRSLENSEKIRFAGFTLDVIGCTLTATNGQDVPLRRAEFALLLALLRSPGRVLSKDHLLDAVFFRTGRPLTPSMPVGNSACHRIASLVWHGPIGPPLRGEREASLNRSNRETSGWLCLPGSLSEPPRTHFPRSHRLRWPRKIGQVSKLGSPFEKDGPDDGQTEAVCGGVQGESCS
jgi:Transcriptional regulatory protein, C terminal